MGAIGLERGVAMHFSAECQQETAQLHPAAAASNPQLATVVVAALIQMRTRLLRGSEGLTWSWE